MCMLPLSSVAPGGMTLCMRHPAPFAAPASAQHQAPRLVVPPARWDHRKPAPGTLPLGCTLSLQAAQLHQRPRRPAHAPSPRELPAWHAPRTLSLQAAWLHQRPRRPAHAPWSSHTRPSPSTLRGTPPALCPCRSPSCSATGACEPTRAPWSSQTRPSQWTSRCPTFRPRTRAPQQQLRRVRGCRGWAGLWDGAFCLLISAPEPLSRAGSWDGAFCLLISAPEPSVGRGLGTVLPAHLCS